jgi:hypothetical protein
MDQTLINLLLALITNEFLHNIAEVSGMRKRITELDFLSRGKEPKKEKELPIKISNSTSAMIFATVLFVVVVGLLWALFTWIDLSGNAALWYGIVVLVLTYFTTAYTVDKFHWHVNKVAKRLKKK